MNGLVLIGSIAQNLPQVPLLAAMQETGSTPRFGALLPDFRHPR